MASSRSTAKDVSPSVSRQVCYKARVNAYLPATSTDAEVVDDRLHWCESPVATVATDDDVTFAETNDVEASVSSNISKKAEMSVETPTTGIVTKVVQSESGGAEVQATVVSGN